MTIFQSSNTAAVCSDWVYHEDLKCVVDKLFYNPSYHALLENKV